MPRPLTKVALQTFDGLIVRVGAARVGAAPARPARARRVEDKPERQLTGRRGDEAAYFHRPGASA